MKTFAVRRLIAVALFLYLGISVAGCGSKPDGKYTDASGVASLEFKSDKVTFTGPGISETGTYTMDGDKITIKPDKASGESLTLTMMKDGSIQGNGETFTKSNK